MQVETTLKQNCQPTCNVYMLVSVLPHDSNAVLGLFCFLLNMIG